MRLGVTLNDFFHDFTHEMLHVDGRLFQSVRRLMLSPGFLTREYTQGRRARWISPIRLYLLFSVIFFGLSAFTGFRVGLSSANRDSGWNVSLGNTPGASVSMDDDEARALGFENARAMQAAISQALLAWVPRVMFVLLPLFAGLVALAYRSVDHNYLHHVIFAIHVHAAWFAASGLAKALELVSPSIGAVLGQLAIVFAVIYMVLAMRRVYGRVRFAFVRIAFVLTAYAVAFVLAFVAIVIPLVLPGILRDPA